MPTTRKISELPLATGPTGGAFLPLVEGTTTRRLTLTDLATFTGTATGPTGPSGDDGSGEVYQGTTAPAEASAGSTWLDTSSGRYFTRFAGVWIEVGGDRVE